MGHCYVHFAFVFTLIEDGNKIVIVQTSELCMFIVCHYSISCAPENIHDL